MPRWNKKYVLKLKMGKMLLHLSWWNNFISLASFFCDVLGKKSLACKTYVENIFLFYFTLSRWVGKQVLFYAELSCWIIYITLQMLLYYIFCYTIF